MSTRAEPDVRPIAISIADAAAELGVSTDKVLKWVTAGRLKAFVDPDSRLGVQRGPKTVRIFREDWRRFLEAHTVVGVVAETQAEARPAPAAAGAVGPDGVSRRNRKRSARR
ncbi:helix-turn-helix domain-containing protein [Singulisphaera sp. PoT]|uniref:helix-turn-helix domain-containing protein n=1 Tax=Singulisphaera sp. PoT TaxID=3411797 RepID=UPI003BF61DAE